MALAAGPAAALEVTEHPEAESIHAARATLVGTVYLTGAEQVDFCQFEYGTTEAYGHTVACTNPFNPDQVTRETVVLEVGGLAPGTTYHFRLAAQEADTRSVKA